MVLSYSISVFKQFKHAAMVAPPLGGVGDAATDAGTALDRPKPKLGGVAHGNALFAEPFPGKPADVFGWNPGASEPRVNLRGRQVRRLDRPERVAHVHLRRTCALVGITRSVMSET